MPHQIDLVFRTVGERTSSVALELALEHIRPDRVHVLENCRPFWRTVSEMLRVDYRGDFVVFMDADCLIHEDLRPFLDSNTQPHVDACLLDKFRGRVTAGLHITRTDVVRAMRDVPPDPHDPSYFLKPESWTRWRALEGMHETEGLKRFRILHDFEQHYEDLFIKYVIRDLRSRKVHLRGSLDRKMRAWNDSDPDIRVARAAVDYSRACWHPRAPKAWQLESIVPGLREAARERVRALGLAAKPEFTRENAESLSRTPVIRCRLERRPTRVFGLTLSPSASKLGSRALAGLGLNVVQNGGPQFGSDGQPPRPAELANLADFDAVAGLALAPFYSQMDAAYPESVFCLFVRERESWLREIESVAPAGRHAGALARALGLPSFEAPRAAEWLAAAADSYHRDVTEYFESRPGRLIRFDLQCDLESDALMAQLEASGLGLPPL